jgi:hypothetical protein
MKRRDEGLSPGTNGGEPSLSAEEEAELITEWYAGAFPATPQSATLVADQQPTVTEKRARLVETVRVEDAEVRQLAQDRADHIRARLLEKGTVQQDRVVLREVQLKEESGSMVNTRLTVSGR